MQSSRRTPSNNDEDRMIEFSIVTPTDKADRWGAADKKRLCGSTSLKVNEFEVLLKDLKDDTYGNTSRQWPLCRDALDLIEASTCSVQLRRVVCISSNN